MKLTAFRYGTTEINEGMAFTGGDKNVKIPISLLFFLLEIDNRKILIDTGCDTMPGFPLFEFKKPIEVLEDYGIKAEDISDVLITHAHGDHIDCVRYYKAAEIYINENEETQAKRYVSDINKLHTFRESLILNDNVCFKYIGGHSPGSSIVLINTPDTVYVLCGDECYTKENLHYAKPTASSFNIEKSSEFVNEYRKEKYTPIIFHDEKLVEKIGGKVIFEY